MRTTLVSGVSLPFHPGLVIAGEGNFWFLFLTGLVLGRSIIIYANGEV